MAGSRSSLVSSTPVLATADYPSARSFYCDKLGYRVVEEGGDPARFGIFRREGSTLFIDGWNDARTPTPNIWSAYIHVNNIDALAAEFQSKGVVLSRGLENTIYGMREFEIIGPDRVVLCFGEDAEVS